LKKEVLSSTDPEISGIIEDDTGFVGMVVSRMVPAASKRFGISDSLFAVADSYHRLSYDGSAVKAGPLPIEGMEAVKNFKAVFDRKMYTLNLTHASLGYLGFLKGYHYVHEPFSDKQLNPIIEGAMEEISEALLKKYPDDLETGEQKEMIKDTEIRFGNPMLLDSITRVARDPLRKLGPEDRLVGSASLCLDQGIFPHNIALVCGAALNYDHSGDESAVKMERMIHNIGIVKAIDNITGLNPKSKLAVEIIGAYRFFKDKRTGWNK
jgi:mannitol-1-phosphate 5-dehydrogenase